MKAKRLLCLLLSLMMLFALSACGKEKPQSEITEEEDSKLVLTDTEGREVTLDKHPQRIIATSAAHGGAFLTMCAILGDEVTDYLVGWDDSLEQMNKDIYDNITKDMPKLKDIPNVGMIKKDAVNVEKILELKPDLCIFSSDEKETVEATLASQLNEAKIPYVYIELVDEKTENQEKSARLIGQILDKEEKVDEILKLSVSKRKEVEERVAKLEKEGKEKPSVYFECASRGVDEYGWTYSNEVQWGYMTALAGGNNIGEGKYDKYGQMDLETLLRANPDHIFISGAYWPEEPTALRMGYDVTEQDVEKQLEAYKNRKGWDQLKAVQNGQVHTIYNSLGCELYDFAALEFIAKTIYPEEFKDMDPNAELKEYFEKFMPFQLNGTWMMQ